MMAVLPQIRTELEKESNSEIMLPDFTITPGKATNDENQQGEDESDERLKLKAPKAKDTKTQSKSKKALSDEYVSDEDED